MMGNRLIFGYILVILFFAYAGCDTSGSDDTSGVVTLQGQVLNAETNNPVEGAFVRIQPSNSFIEADVEGRFEIALEIDSTMTLQVTATKDGFSQATQSVTALADRIVTVPPLRIRAIQEEGLESGEASNILLLSQSDQSIGIRESGAQEVVEVVFQVADSLGRPVTLDNAVELVLSLGQHPGGGEFIFPTREKTDSSRSQAQSCPCSYL
jgi:hypothetical protein